MTDVSAILVASAEGPRIGISLHSALDAATAARDAGLEVEVLVVLASPTPATQRALVEATGHGARVLPVDATGPGAVRNAAVAAAQGRHLAFLDGGALWSDNWLVAAHALCATDPAAIAHPEIHWFYELGRELYFTPDQGAPDFDPALLRLGSCWDGQPLAAAEVFRAVPFSDDAWEWNAATAAAGYVHRVAPATINFARRRPATLR